MPLALLVIACGILDQRPSPDDFPDAGPGGPDSAFAGVGQGIPFGESDLPELEFGQPYSGAFTGTSRGSLAALLRRAQASKTRLVLKLASKRDYTNPDGTFNLDLWKRQVDQYRD